LLARPCRDRRAVADDERGARHDLYMSRRRWLLREHGRRRRDNDRQGAAESSKATHMYLPRRNTHVHRPARAVNKVESAHTRVAFCALPTAQTSRKRGGAPIESARVVPEIGEGGT